MPKQPLKKSDLFFVFLAITGLLLHWTGFDPTGYLLYSSLIVITTITVIGNLKNKALPFKYPKWIFLVILTLIIITGIDRITFKALNPSFFLICYLIYVLIQPKPAWITRP